MLTLDAIYDSLGGPAEVGRIIGKSTEHAASFRRRGKIPVAYWPHLIAALQTKGVEASHDDFVRIYNDAGKRQAPAPEPAS